MSNEEEEEDWGDVENDEFSVENTFHEAEYLLKDEPLEALAKFKSVIEMEEESGDKQYSLEARKYTIILYLKLR